MNDDLNEDQPADVLQETEALRDELNEMKDRALRAAAELENVRRRMRKEMDDERKYAAAPLLKDLLPVVDNLRRALEHADKSKEGANVVAGVQMVAQQLQEVFAKQHCTKIEALHKPFDPHVHEAIGQQPSADYPPNTVLIVAQDGYQLHDRVLRPAQVIVSTQG